MATSVLPCPSSLRRQVGCVGPMLTCLHRTRPNPVCAHERVHTRTWKWGKRASFGF